MKTTTTTMAAIALICLNLVACSSGDGSDTPEANANASTPAINFAEIGSGIEEERLVSHVKYLSSDELAGRAPGSQGEELTLIYLTEQYQNAGLQPGNPDRTFVQEVPLVATTVTNTPLLELQTKDGAMPLKFTEEFMGWTMRKKHSVSVKDAELVFVGYGVVAPEYGWDDYKGQDVSGKILVMFVGDPPIADETMFGGTAMTYYGRWTYKYEIAAEKGAAGAIIVHKEDTAGYPWAVVSNSWSGEQFDIVRKNDGMDRCALEGWVTTPSAKKVFAAAGLDLDQAYRNAVSIDFEPVAMGITGSATIESSFRTIRSYNLVAMLEGNDPAHKDEFIVYTAHWDHLGTGNAVDGDDIYNGALDNATGVAGTLEIARAMAAHGDQLKRSVLFINTTAEESGLLGSYHYAEEPLFPLTKTVAEINIDGLNVWGRTKDMVVVGFGHSQLDDYLARAIDSQGRFLKPDAEPQKGSYYRSDHFPFAKKGVPSLYADSGIEYIGKPKNWGLDIKKEYTSNRYHKPQDEFDPTWDFSGAVEDMEALFRVGMMIGTTTDYPSWRDGSEFKEIREQALKASR